MDTISARFAAWCTDVVGPILRPFFGAVDSLLNPIYMPWARICALGLFIGAMIWVYSLREEYVNIDAPRKAWYTDLRIWTVLSMLPHVVVYLLL